MEQAGSAGLMLLGTLAGLTNVPSEDGDSFRRFRREPVTDNSSHPVQDPPAHESLRRRRHSHDAKGLTEIKICRTGKVEDRRQRVFKEWLASGRAAGNGKAKAFATMLNEYVSTHPDIAVQAQADGDLQFNSNSLGLLLAEAANSGDQVKKKKGSGKQGNHWVVRAPQAFGRRQTVVDQRTLSELRLDRKRLRDILRLQPKGPRGQRASMVQPTRAPSQQTACTATLSASSTRWRFAGLSCGPTARSARSPRCTPPSCTSP